MRGFARAGFACAVLLTGIFLSTLAPAREITITNTPPVSDIMRPVNQVVSLVRGEPIVGYTASTTPTRAPLVVATPDIAPESPLANPPEVVKAVYATNWSAGSSKKIDSLISFIERNGMNGIVIDIKDYSGVVGYANNIAEVERIGAWERRIADVTGLLRKLHEKNIYVVGRIAVFQDQRLLAARPELAVRSSASGDVWRDKNGLGWVDPASREVWDYTVSIANDAFARGFDEVNFDYIRFPSDGNLADLSYPIWKQEVSSRADTMRDFYAYMRQALMGKKISADIFGLSVVEPRDLGIGQLFENTLNSFDTVAPMVYPSHYANGFLGYANPAQYPYEVINYSLIKARDRISVFESLSTATSTATSTTRAVPGEPIAKIRPWLQVFNLGDTYDATKIRAQIKAAEDAGATGYMLWSPSNVYIDFAETAIR